MDTSRLTNGILRIPLRHLGGARHTNPPDDCIRLA
jgi:hypothetical protein